MKKPQIHLTSYDQLFNQHSRDNISSPKHVLTPSASKKNISKPNKSNIRPSLSSRSWETKNTSCQRQAKHQKSIQLNFTKNSRKEKLIRNKQKTSLSKSPISNKNRQKQFNQHSVSVCSMLENYNSFLQQITKILLNNIKINDPTKLLSHRISYIEFLECMKQLKMIQNDYDPMDKESILSELVSQLWNKYIAKNNVANFVNTIGVILGCTGKQQNKTDYAIQKKYVKLYQKRNNNFEQDSKEGCLKRVQTVGSQVSKHEHVSVNLRIQTEENLLQTQSHDQRHEKQEGIQQPYSFRKQQSITERFNNKNSQVWKNANFSNKQNKCLLNFHGISSNRLSNLTRNQLMQTDRTLNSKSTFQEDNKKKKKVISKVTIQTKQGNQTFDKHLLSRINRSINLNKDPAGNRRSEILYKLGRQKSQQKRQDKSTVDYEYQRNYKHLTFRPQINTYNQAKKKHFDDNLQISKRVNGQQSAIKRLLKGRIDKQVKKIIVSRGLPNNQLTVRKIREEQYQVLMNSKKRKEKNNSITSKSTAHNEQTYKQQFNQRAQHQELQSQRNQYEETQIAIAQNLNEVNIPTKVNHSKSKSAVVVPICIGSQQFHLIVNEQQESLEQIAHRFLTEHNLSIQENMENFVKEIEKALKFSLDLIYQDEEFQNSQYE